MLDVVADLLDRFVQQPNQLRGIGVGRRLGAHAAIRRNQLAPDFLQEAILFRIVYGSCRSCICLEKFVVYDPCQVNLLLAVQVSGSVCYNEFCQDSC